MKRIVGAITGIIGVLLCIKGIIDRPVATAAVSIIGGADGPTSIFLAGKVGTGLPISIPIAALSGRIPIVLGIILLVISGILIFRKKK